MRARARLALVALALLAAALPAPGAAQDAAPAPVLLLEDARSDVSAEAAGTPADVPDGTWDNMDLLSLSAIEGQLDVRLVLGLASLEASQAHLILAGVQYETLFRHNDQLYQLAIYTSGGSGTQEYYGYLEQMPPGEDPEQSFGNVLGTIPIEVDAEARTLTAIIPRGLLTDTEGATPYPGRVLDLFQVRATYFDICCISAFGTAAPMPRIADRMPQEGAGQVPLPIQLGITQSGDLRLDSDEPFRASNGEASTFVFRVNATNLAPRETVAEFVAVGVPAAWDVRLPGMVRLEANETVEFPVIARTAFAHAHGSVTAFTLELVSQSDSVSVGRIQLGLRYPAIAQPAGHHNQVFLHTADMGGDNPLNEAFGLVNKGLSGYDYLTMPYFNTATPEEDVNDAAVPVAGSRCAGLRMDDDNDTIGASYCWYAPLVPGLEMGLDFDLAALGSYSIPVSTVAPQPGARMQGTLVYYAPVGSSDDPFAYYEREAIVVATLLPTERVEMGAQGRHVFEGTIRPERAGDLVRYARGGALELHLEMRTSRIEPILGPSTGPEMTPGATLTLPLLEYQDPIDDVYGVQSLLHVVVEGEAQREANPGQTVLFDVTLHNAASEAQEVDLTLIGSNRDWASLVGATTLRLDADEGRTVTVAVVLPADAADGDRADLVLEAASTTDVATRALVRLVATADTDAEHVDQAELLAGKAPARDTPGLPLALLAVALMALAVGRREA